MFLKITDKDMVPGTGFSFHIPDHRRSRFFLLPKDSLAHWQQLWRFTVETSFAIASVDLKNTLMRSERRLKNIKGNEIVSTIFVPAGGPSYTFTSSISANIAFLSYGGLHLLAWRYHFRSTAESILWKMAGVFTASSGAVPLVLGLAGNVCNDIGAACRSSSPTHKTLRLIGWVSDKGDSALAYSFCAYIIANMVARTYLFVESFVALPNSPPSTYQIPPWTAYVPHI
jgi:hypothetical protein